MTLYVERVNPISDVVVWCGHREFDAYQNSDIGSNDFTVLVAIGTFIVLCRDCFINFANLVLDDGIYVPNGSGPLTVWCKHRTWINNVGQPEAGDLEIEVLKNESLHLVLCPSCAERFCLRVAEKAIRLKFEDAEALEGMVAGGA